VVGEIFIANAFIGNLDTTLKLILTTNAIAVFTYYFHERIWEHIKWKRKE
jgi:uncharacterized membrane protein